MIFPTLFHPDFPIQPPPLRGTSFHRKEGVSTLAPSLGRGWRAQRGGVGFLFLQRSGTFVNGALELIFPTLFHPASALSAPFVAPSPRGEGFVRRYGFFTYACIRFDVMGKAVFSYRSLPHWGRGTASAVDRVLSLIVDLRCIFSLSFIPLEPYPARYARHLPLEGQTDDTRETCCQETFGHRSIYICGEPATTTLNPEPEP